MHHMPGIDPSIKRYAMRTLPGYLAMEAADYAPLIYLTALLNLLNQDSIKNMNSKIIITKNTK